jgi:hypothetical protein
MRRGALLVICMAAALAIPSGAAAKPTKQDRANAAKECKALRGTTDESREAFRALYRNLGACVSEKAREEAAERHAARKNAKRKCRSAKNADKCVAVKAKKAKQAADREDREDAEEVGNAAEECAGERDAMGDKAFEEAYGTNGNKRNAFGKCVAGKTHDDSPGEDDDEDEGEPPTAS